jgi:hypothetical protein
MGYLISGIRDSYKINIRMIREYDEIYTRDRIRESEDAATAQTGQDLQSDRRINKAVSDKLLAVWAAK